jgi:hypothetical protein
MNITNANITNNQALQINYLNSLAQPRFFQHAHSNNPANNPGTSSKIQKKLNGDVSQNNHMLNANFPFLK